MGSEEVVSKARADAAAGRATDAIESLRRLVSRSRRDAGAHAALAEILVRAGQRDQAVYFAGRAVELAPGNAEVLNTLGYVRMNSGELAGAVEVFERVLAIDPGHLLALSHLCGALRTQGRLDEAAGALQRMLAEHAENEFAYADANLLGQLGDPRAAAALLRRAVERFPHAVWLRRDLCAALNYTDDASEEEVLRAHAVLGAALPKPAVIEPADRDPDRPLRVGYVSPDFREHSVSSFLRPLVDCAGLGIVPVCYHCTSKNDDTTRSLRAAAEAAGGVWREAASLSNPALARAMRDDRLDIAVDLAGWTGGSRLFALAARVAPVQVSYLGYPNTTGLPAMDYRLVDALTDPPEHDGLATERLVRLDPCFLCFSPGEGWPEPLAGAPGAGRPVVFGSFNKIHKVTPTTVRLWAGALRAVEGSRMLIKAAGLSAQRVRGHLLDQFAGEGIGAERLELLDRVESRAEHLALYGRVDVALDTYPYHGTTTTCEALWMGVPVVTLAGPGHRSRVGLSLLAAAGLADLSAATPEGFVQTAAAMAGDGARRAALRRTLRDQVRQSPLCDGARLARELARTWRKLWRRRCAAP